MGTRHRVYRNDDCVYDFTEPDVGVPPGGGSGGPVDPPPGGGGQPPGYSGPVVFNMGVPGEKSPTDLQRALSAETVYSLKFTKTGDANTMRLMGAPQWFNGVHYRIEGRDDLGERYSNANGGMSDLDHSGTANGEVVIHFRLHAGVSSGMVAPQLF